jgi:uncharacterized protein (UPF0261 family)
MSSPSQPRVALLGTLDTKREECLFIRDRLLQAGAAVTLIDVGIPGAPVPLADVSSAEVARTADTSIEALLGAGDRASALDEMATGAERLLRELVEAGELHGVLGVGGSGGTALLSRPLRALPIGLPKVIVSTVASGNTRPYVGISDLVLMPSVVDVAGLNRISSAIFANAAASIVAMAASYAGRQHAAAGPPVVGATMFGLTTPCVHECRSALEAGGYEVMVFHATGVGGAQFESLARQRQFDLVLDITTTELADELVGGIFSAGESRLTGAGASSIPQVVSVGALDMVNFGPLQSVPDQFRGRLLHRHNEAITLMRTSVEECAELGRRMALRLNGSRGPVSVFVPMGGFSALGGVGEAFHHPRADQAVLSALKQNLDPSIELQTLDLHINDGEFAAAMVERLLRYSSEDHAGNQSRGE